MPKQTWMDKHVERLRWGVPIKPTPCVEIVRRGTVMAKVYTAPGESREEMLARAKRMAAGYSGTVVEVRHES